MRITIPALSIALLAPTAALAQTSTIAAAVGAFRQVVQTYGVGVQIYGCQPVNGTPQFIALGPDAALYQLPLNGQTGPQQVATHSIGPVWQANDGSGVFGTVVLSVASQSPNSIAQLLLRTQPFGTAAGTFSPVVYVTRTETVNGTSPTAGCDAAHVGTTARVPYTAVYTFYAAQ